MKKIILMLTIMFTALSCKRTKSDFSHQKNIALLDTLLTVDSLNFLQKGTFSGLFNATAETAIQEYFNKFEYYKTEDSASVELENDILLCASFDSLYHVNLNADKYIDGLVTYYDMPCFASGHCYQPHLAIVTFIDGKYRFISRDLLPDNYYIDSITQDKNFTYLHGSIYDCSEHEFIRRYRAKIPRN